MLALLFTGAARLGEKPSRDVAVILETSALPVSLPESLIDEAASSEGVIRGEMEERPEFRSIPPTTSPLATMVIFACFTLGEGVKLIVVVTRDGGGGG
jgi:hypothetical protein